MKDKRSQRPQGKAYFLLDLARKLAAQEGTSMIRMGGSQFDLSSILDSTGEVTVTGFSGVILYVKKPTGNKSGQLAFQVFKEGVGQERSRYEYFSLRRLGIEKAFNDAIKCRAAMVGYEGEIPFLEPPALADITKALVSRFGAEWVADNKRLIYSVCRISKSEYELAA